MNIKNKLKIIVLAVMFISTCSLSYAFEKVVTVPAQAPEGVTLDLEKGSYVVEFSAGAVSLFFPINPSHCWLVASSVGVKAKGGQDNPDLGTIYFSPQPPVHSQVEAEEKALAAVQDKVSGTSLEFILEEDKTVRFWVSDFDYNDNSGMIKLKIKKIE